MSCLSLFISVWHRAHTRIQPPEEVFAGRDE